MRNDKLIPGLVLVLIGAAILLSNYGYLHFHWYNIFRLWPIFLIIGGVNLVFAQNKSPLATIVKVSVVIVGLGLLFFGNFGNRYNFWPGNRFGYYSDDNDDNDTNNNNNKDDDDDDDDDNNGTAVKVAGNGEFKEPYNAGIKAARLNISGGGTSYNLSDTTSQLFDATVKNSSGKYEFSHSKDDSVYVLDFHMKNHSGFQLGSHNNEATIWLNPKPNWEVNVEAGATALNFDLSKFKVSKLKIDGGAASFTVKMGAPLVMTDIDISTGVSSVEISIPQGAACSIETDSGLSDNHFEGFNKTSDNNYETSGFDAARNKMHIHISGGLSDFKVRRY